jgi:hypothetical protein
MTYRPARAKPKRRRWHDALGQARFDLPPHDGRSDLDREVQEHIEQTRREPLPGQAGLPLKQQGDGVLTSEISLPDGAEYTE